MTSDGEPLRPDREREANHLSERHETDALGNPVSLRLRRQEKVDQGSGQRLT
jgi:hypothetical protein